MHLANTCSEMRKRRIHLLGWFLHTSNTPVWRKVRLRGWSWWGWVQ